jgi:hypothetical protein
MSNGSAHGITQDRLGFHKVCARCVSKQLIGENKRKRLKICQCVLNCYGEKVTFYEINCHWGRDPYPLLCSRKQRPEYRMETSDIAGQREVQNSTIVGKSDVGNFCDLQRPISEHCRERHTIISSVRYSEMPRDQMKLAIRTKHRGLLSKCGSMSHDNVRPYTLPPTPLKSPANRIFRR